MIHAVFCVAETSAGLKAVEAADLRRSNAGARHVLSVPQVRALAADPRMRDLAARFIGSTAIPFPATLFDKSARVNWLIVWHQDTALPLRERVNDSEWGPWSMKGGVVYAHAPPAALEKVLALRVSIDDSTEANGLCECCRSHTCMGRSATPKSSDGLPNDFCGLLDTCR